MEFKNEQTRKLFTPTGDKDQRVLQPASKDHGEYDGLLSMISPAIAESMYTQGCNLLIRNAAPTNGKQATSTDKN